MPKLRVLSGNQVCNILKKHNFVKTRQSGSHIIMRRDLPDRSITVPVPNHSEIARGTLKSIIQQSELPKSEFMR
jgi:predicted RNA binding protein YcfA (HicA-like mRNA interferase family)